MPKYIVKEMHLLHGRKGEKKAESYAPGDIVELSPAEAAAIGSNVAPYVPPKPEEKEGDKK